MVPEPCSRKEEGYHQNFTDSDSTVSEYLVKEKTFSSQITTNKNSFLGNKHGEGPNQTCACNAASVNLENEKYLHPHGTTVWLRCDVYDTGIGIPGRLDYAFVIKNLLIE